MISPQRLRVQAWLLTGAVVMLGWWAPALATADQSIKGVVFEDRNGNGQREADEPGLAQVGVSNGRDVVTTDAQGRYQLTIDDDDIVFVIKPRNYLPRMDALNLPRFYYIHKPAGSPKSLRYSGVEPTGPLPESIDFPLTAHREPDHFSVVVLGDPQSRDKQEISYLAHDLVAELIGTDAAFGLSLGDIVFDNLAIYPAHNQVISTIGIPWFNVLGNHDTNYDAPGDELANETWKRHYGPLTYSFDWGPVHFIVLDNVAYQGLKKDDQGVTAVYHGEIGHYLTFIENDLRLVPKDRLVVLTMHIPLDETKDRDRLFDLLQERPHTFSLSAHTHYLKHAFFDAEQDWKRPQPHHHLIHHTACGAWWGGTFDERGIPVSPCRGGAPNGYSIITFAGNHYSVRFKAASRPAADQMAIWAPDAIAAHRQEPTEVLANVYAGCEKNVVEMRLVGKSDWQPMTMTKRVDPYMQALRERTWKLPDSLGRTWGGPAPSAHLWTAQLAAGLKPGVYVIEVRSRDMFGQVDFGRRIVRVE